ncbi:16S rRNA (cytosine(1402)-N(4))-methyltransferase RsmH [Ruminococcus albus]|uniref:Ribosomal RNA small subunit methyltransferase H n=1 Tax=Ruminococcus albus 8 TaxID=246199 RepID=E9SB74_RUMAL|nr:16S rRNA (cytosine(1402)-N(4))-methyltransferase RsmH [Ruminococcus albus]EGC03404.1 S-adenosyl-methyltransferase MraW [Ruminococcus albus 8]MCC3350228.1 16S rRNA (cytosine(1402)-N(4))-methyltransferase RsmH [Ruminococcus albus 8]
MEFRHVPVLLEECIEGLDIKPDGIYCDGTAGGAGHSKEIAKRLTTGRLISVDRDPEAVAVATERLAGLPATVVRGNYSELDEIFERLGLSGADGILMDLGVSSYQLDNAERGFSYHADAPLDMRMSSEGLSARDVVNGYDEKTLARIIFEYGEEKYSRSIARRIVEARQVRPIETTLELAEIIKTGVPQKVRREKNPCKKTFQAIRIEVNAELEHLSVALDKAFDLLNVGGRLCIITFHSLEDRLVKQRFRGFCQGCVCPPDFPVCVCGRTPRGRLVTRKPIEPTERENTENKRAHSAKLRIIEKIKEEKDPNVTADGI